MNALSRLARSILSFIVPSKPAAPAPPSSGDPRAAGQELRARFLATTAAELNLKPSPDFPRVFGVAMDWSIGDETATIAALCDGTASLYTTSTFGIIGGGGHESVRSAARRFVQAADAFYDDGVPASEFEYPLAESVYFFLCTFAGVRALTADVAAIHAGTSRYSALFGAGQDVLTELRKVTEDER